MLSLKYITENKKDVKKFLKAKNIDFDLDNLLSLDVKRKSLISKVEKIKSKRNILNKNISELKKNNQNPSDLIDEMKEYSLSIKDIDSNLNVIISDLNNSLLYVPNIIHESVPIGDETNNKVIREWGKKPKFDFTIKSHKELCEINNLVDFKRSINMSGSGFPLYVDKGSKLERSLINYMLDTHAENSYTELFPPFIVSSKSPKTTGNLPKFKDNLYPPKNRCPSNFTKCPCLN